MHFSPRIFGSNRKKLSKYFQSTKRRTSRSFNFRENVEKFSSSTSLHGFKYIGEKGSVSEKIFWSTVLTCVLILCVFQIIELIKYWNEGKIVETKETTKIQVRDIPFPAVTFCSGKQFNNRLLDEAEIKLDADVYKDTIMFGDTLCWNKEKDAFQNQTHSNKAIHYTFTELSYMCRKLFYRISYMNDVLPNHCTYTQVYILGRGKCYSFNMVPHDQLIVPSYAKILKSYSSDKYFVNDNDTIPNWEPNSGFRKKDSVSPPWRIPGATSYNSFKFELNLNAERFLNRCRYLGNGVTILVHSPVDHPSYSTNFYIASNTYTRVVLIPKMVTASDELLTWAPKNRGCYYDGEKRLKFFKVYTQKNCEIECTMNETLRSCGCVAHHHPRIGSTPVCSSNLRQCVRDAGSSGYSIFTGKVVLEGNVHYYPRPSCKCLPTCSEITYSIEVNEISRNFTFATDSNSQNETELKYTNMAVLEVCFKHVIVNNSRRSPMIRWNELIANIGGVMSLCVGCSIVSLFEVVYFIVFRKYFIKSTKISYDKPNTFDGRSVIFTYLK